MSRSTDPGRRWTPRAVLGRLHRRPSGLVGRAVVLAVLLIAASASIMPLYWLFSASLKAPGALQFPPQVVPTDLSLANFAALIGETAFVRTYLANSLIVSAATVLLTVAIATPAGYALSRFDVRYKSYVLVGLLAVQMMPILAMILPLYRLFSALGLLDTLAVVILTDTVLVVPIATWLIKGYCDTIPRRLDEAAYVGGASRFGTFLVLVPLARPAVGAAAIFAFVQSWNQFVIPLTFTSSPAVRTFPVGLFEFISRRGVVDWGLLGAASLAAMLPVLVLYALFHRHFIAGLLGTGAQGGRP